MSGLAFRVHQWLLEWLGDVHLLTVPSHGRESGVSLVSLLIRALIPS